MTKRIETMRRLRDDLKELFQLCGIQAEAIEVRPAPALIRLAERLSQDHALNSYLEAMEVQAEQAIIQMKDRALDDWNNRQNEARIVELEQERILAGKERQRWEQERVLVEKERQGWEQERILAEKERQRWEQERALAEKERQRLEQELQEERDRGERRHKEQLSLIQDMIALRDKLLLRRNWLEDQAHGEENARKLVDSQLRETARCLTNMGVEILDAGGSFDNSFQAVVETCPAEMPEQEDQIAETFRPGYRFRDEILRPQEVIVYTVMPQLG